MIKYSIIIPVYKNENIAKNAVLSAARQFRSSKEEHKKFSDWTIECVIVNDSPDCDMSSLLNTFNDNKICKDYTCKYIVMESNQGEGNARIKGIKECSGEYFYLMDMDDVYGPNCVSKCNEIIVTETEKGNKVSMVEYPFTSFDVGYTHIIEPYSIWVQGRVYNKEFVTSHNIYSTDLSSRAGADYNFMSKLHGIQDYYDRTYQKKAETDKEAKPEWCRVMANQEQAYTWAYWFPSDSQTRKCNFWGDWICPKTVLNGLDAVEFLRAFEESKGEKKERREFWKYDILNKTCYNFINLHSILRQCTTNKDWEDKVTKADSISGEDNNIVFYDLFKKAFLGTSELMREYIDEIWDMDIWTTMEGVWNRSDCHKAMPWLDFRTFVEDPHRLGIFDFNNMKELVDFCKSEYSFDQNGYPLHAGPYKKFIEAQKTGKR